MANSEMLSNPAEEWKEILVWQKILENEEPFVDLGLSVKWGRCNLGANSPEENGDYYAWGEVKTKDEYTEENSLTFQKKYSDIAGNPEYDAATAHLGKGVRLPTKEEIEELIDNTTQIWTECNGVLGYIVISDINGNSIFLPAAGYRGGTSLYDAGAGGNFWSSTPYEGTDNDAYYLRFNSGGFDWDWGDRDFGLSVCPVRD